MKNTKKIIAVITAIILLISVMLLPQTVSATDYKTMRDITAWELISEMTVGINIGNSLDSALNEGSGETAWGNPKITKDLILAYKNAGFNTIRLPVTWKGNMNSDGSAKTAWLNRVKEVVDWILEEGLYCIINTHHEQSWLNTNSEGMSARTLKFKNLWTSIANEFADYGDHLLFEGFNEILKAESDWSAATTTDYQNANSLSQAFVDAVRATGGKNSNRILISSTYGAIHQTYGFDIPNDTATDKIAVEFHCYSPQSFCFPDGDQTTWGSSSDNATVNNFCRSFYNDFTSEQIPVILGEFGAVNKGNTSARASYTEKVIATCARFNIMPIWWDNGVLASDDEDYGIINRDTYKIEFPEIVSALVNVPKATSSTTLIPLTKTTSHTFTEETVQLSAPIMNNVVLNGKTSAKISWKASTGADSYTIYRSNSPSSGYKAIKTGLKTLTYTDATLSAGKTYYYKVEAVKGTAKSISAAKYVKVLNYSAKPVIKLKSAKKAVKVQFKTKVANATTYQVYYATSKKFKGKKVITVTGNKKIKKLKSGKKYFVKARAVTVINGKKYYSKWSNSENTTVK